MKRFFAIFLCIILTFSLLPAFAESEGIEAMGSFQGRLLSDGYAVTYDVTLTNKTGEPQTVSVMLAQYSGASLAKLTPYSVELSIAETKSETYTISAIEENVSEVRAFVFFSNDSVKPLIRSDKLNLTYESIYSDYMNSNLVTQKESISLEGEALSNRFPVHETFRTVSQKAYINGASVLAWYDAAPTEIYASITQGNYGTNAHFKQFRTLRVINPAGEVVCYHDFSEENAAQSVVLKIPAYTGEPGIWTISYVGGKFTDDEVTIGIPETPYYGIRGDMFIGFNHRTQKTLELGTNRKWYVYVPESCVGADAVFLLAHNKAFDAYLGEVFNSITITRADGTILGELLDANGNSARFEPNLKARGKVAQVREQDADTVWSFDIGDYYNWIKDGTDDPYGVYHPNSLTSTTHNALYVSVANGLPGLFCPTEAAARKLKGGIALSEDNRVLGGVLQAEARNVSREIAKENLEVSAEFPEELPQEVKDGGYLGVEALTVAAQGGITDVRDICTQQNVNPDDIFLGSMEVTEFATTDTLTHRDNFENFTYSSASRDIYSAGALASRAGLPTKLNGLYGDPGMVRRAALALLSHFVEMSPEDLLRGYGMTVQITRDANGNITNESFRGDYWPCSRIFFTYPNLADAYNLLKDKVTPETAQIMKNSLLRIGDKLANYQANDANQWSEIIRGHMEVYLATGEERFLRYFERHAASIGQTPVDVNSFGQNSAGAYLERMAPSAQYAQQAMHNFLPCYYSYRNLPNRNEEVLRKFEASLSRAVYFEALNWMPENPGGQCFSPTAIMVKGKNGNYNPGGGMYPNFSYASVGFPVAARMYDISQNRWAASPSTDGADIYYRLPMAAEEILNDTLFNASFKDKLDINGKPDAYTAPRSYEIFTQEIPTSDRMLLPIEETDRVWKFDDLLAWKKNGMYVLNYYSNQFSTPAYNIGVDAMASRGGLPFAVWSEGTGPVVMSQYLNTPTVAQHLPNYEERKDTYYYSGVVIEMADGTTHNTRFSEGTLVEENSTGYTITQPIGLETVSQTDASGNTVKVPKYGVIRYDATYTDTGYTISVTYEPTEAGKNPVNAYIQLPITRPNKASYWAVDKNGNKYYDDNDDLRATLTQSNNNKTLNYKSLLEGAYGSMNIHTSTQATLGSLKAYGSYARNAVQLLTFPLENNQATVTFEIVAE